MNAASRAETLIIYLYFFQFLLYVLIAVPVNLWFVEVTLYSVCEKSSFGYHVFSTFSTMAFMLLYGIMRIWCCNQISK